MEKKELDRKELVEQIEALARECGTDNLYARLVLTALAAAVYTATERRLARHVAKFDFLLDIERKQQSILQEALAILRR